MLRVLNRYFPFGKEKKGDDTKIRNENVVYENTTNGSEMMKK